MARWRRCTGGRDEIAWSSLHCRCRCSPCESSDGIAVTRSASDDISQETAIDRLSAAYEGSALGHGVLTCALLQGMKSADPASPGTRLWTKELDNYVVRRVPDLSKSLGREQPPHNKLTSDFPLGLRVAGINLAEIPAASAVLPGVPPDERTGFAERPVGRKALERIARSTEVLKLKGECDATSASSATVRCAAARSCR